MALTQQKYVNLLYFFSCFPFPFFFQKNLLLRFLPWFGDGEHGGDGNNQGGGSKGSGEDEGEGKKKEKKLDRE